MTHRWNTRVKNNFLSFTSSQYFLISLFLLAVIFCVQTFSVETFDFDESIYRRMAEEMKATGHWMSQPFFNGENYNHKPPTYIGILALVSWLIDGSGGYVSSFSCRLVSFVFSLLTVLLIHKTWLRLRGSLDRSANELPLFSAAGISPFYFLLMSFLPTVAGTAVLLDPLLVLCTTLFVCCESLRINDLQLRLKSSHGLSLLSSLGMFGATATKGLIGLVLPAGAIAIFCFWQYRSFFSDDRISWFIRSIQFGLKFFAPQFLLAFVLSLGFYSFLWITGGQAFVEEFFIKHHFGRATSAMEGHGGSVFYYLPILLLGGALTLSWIVGDFSKSLSSRSVASAVHPAPVMEARNEVKNWMLIWCVVCIAFFSFLATKLPNYIWPVWPILALIAALGFDSPHRNENSEHGQDVEVHIEKTVPSHRRFLSRIFGSLALNKITLSCVVVLPFILPLGLFLGCLVLGLWESFFSEFIQLKAREGAVLASVLKHKNQIFTGLFLTGILQWAAASLMRSWTQPSAQDSKSIDQISSRVARSLAFLQIASCVVLSLLILPVAEKVMTEPLRAATHQAQTLLRVNEQMSTAALYSPTVVSVVGQPVRLGIGASEDFFANNQYRVILTPVWNTQICEKYHYDVRPSFEYLRICVRVEKGGK